MIKHLSRITRNILLMGIVFVLGQYAGTLGYRMDALAREVHAVNACQTSYASMLPHVNHVNYKKGK